MARRTGGPEEGAATASPDQARERIARSERLVYLLPQGFDPECLVEAPLGEEVSPLTEIEFESPTASSADAVSVSGALSRRGSGRGFPSQGDVRTFLGWIGREPFAIELRERSATIVAEPFWMRRDLLLAVKERAESPRRSASASEEAA